MRNDNHFQYTGYRANDEHRRGAGKSACIDPSDVRAGRKEIDIGIGVLMGLRGCGEHQAFRSIVDAVNETGVGLGAVCRALASLVSGAGDQDVAPDAVRYWISVIGEDPHRAGERGEV